MVDLGVKKPDFWLPMPEETIKGSSVAAEDSVSVRFN